MVPPIEALNHHLIQQSSSSGSYKRLFPRSAIFMFMGIFSSLIASLVYAGLTVLVTESVRRRRAKPFVGKFRMYNHLSSQATGETVTVERKNWAENLLSSAPILMVFAEHGTGASPGTENWTGTVEALGLSKTATGYFSYPNRDGGALRFKLSRDAMEITEYGTPFDTKDQPFIRVLKREK
jgi:hypothetical protein